MLGIDPKPARAVWTAFLVVLALATVYAVRESIVVFMIALFFSYMLAPVVNFLSDRLPKRIAHSLALAIVYLSLLGVLIAIGATLGTRLADEAGMLAKRLPEVMQKPDWMHAIPLPAWLEPMRDRVIASVQDEFRMGGKDLMPYLTSLGGKLLSSLSSVLFVILIPILAFFFLKDGPALREGLVGGLAGTGRKLADDILNDIHQLLGQYIRAVVLLALSSFVTYTLFLSFTGASYAILLAGVAAVLEFIPVVGPLSAGVIVILVSAFSGYPHLLWFVVFWISARMFQDYVLAPYLMSSGVELHPLLVLFGVLAGEQIGGIPGMFFSVPVIATLRVIYVQAMRARRHRDLGLTKSSESPLAI